MEELVIIGLEYPKNGTEKYGKRPQPPVVYVCKRGSIVDIPDSELTYFRLRSRFNPELRFYAGKFSPEISDDEVVKFAKQVKFSEPYFLQLR